MFLSPSRAQADPPRVLAVQGTLLTSGGTPASGTYSLVMELYTAETGGAAVYSHPPVSVTVAQGVFDAELGPVAPGVVEGASALWLAIIVEGDALPRRPLRSVAWAIGAAQASTALLALDLQCSGCVSSAEVAFAYAASSTKGGAALALDCAGCVTSQELAALAVGPSHVQDSAVGPTKVSFAYAGSASKGGAAAGLACSSCVDGGELVPSLTLQGTLSVPGSVSACTANTSGCGVSISESGLFDKNDGWLHMAVPSGLRLRNLGDTAYQPVAIGGGTSFGSLAVSGGDLTVTGSVGVRKTSPIAPLHVAGPVSYQSKAAIIEGSVNIVPGAGISPFAAPDNVALQVIPYFGTFSKAYGAATAIRLTPWSSGDSVSLKFADWSESTSNTMQISRVTDNARPRLSIGNHSTEQLTVVTASGNVGVGTNNPLARLSVAGGLQVGADTGACSAPRAGTIRLAGVGLESCNGSAWQPLLGGSVKLPNDASACTSANAGTLRWTGASMDICNGSVWVGVRLISTGDGSSAADPARSCAVLHGEYPLKGSGLYWIDPDDSGPLAAIQVYCDMVSHGGGWTLVLAAGFGVDLTSGDRTGDFFPYPSSHSDPGGGSLRKMSDSLINAIKSSSGAEVGYWVTTPGSGVGLFGAEIFHRADCQFKMGQISSQLKTTTCHFSTTTYASPASWQPGGHWWDDSAAYRWAFGHANEGNHGTGNICYQNGTGLGAHSPGYAPFHRGWCSSVAWGLVYVR